MVYLWQAQQQEAQRIQQQNVLHQQVIQQLTPQQLHLLREMPRVRANAWQDILAVL